MFRKLPKTHEAHGCNEGRSLLPFPMELKFEKGRSEGLEGARGEQSKYCRDEARLLQNGLVLL